MKQDFANSIKFKKLENGFVELQIQGRKYNIEDNPIIIKSFVEGLAFGLKISMEDSMDDGK